MTGRRLRTTAALIVIVFAFLILISLIVSMFGINVSTSSAEVSSPGSMTGVEGVTTTIAVRAAPWYVQRTEGQFGLMVGVFTGSCQSPELDHVDVHQGNAFGRASALITVYERFTEYHYPPPPPGTHVFHGCAGVGLRLTAQVRLPTAVRETALLDGSTDPFQRRRICGQHFRSSPTAPPRDPLGVWAAKPVCAQPAF